MTEITILGLALAVLLMISVLYRLVDRVFLRAEAPELELGREQVARIDMLAERRALLVRELKDIEFDYETGKIDDGDFERLTRRYQRQWLEIDRELEAAGGLDAALLAEIDAELERRLAAEAPTAGRVRRLERRICTVCGAANPRHAARCFDCEATLADEDAQGERRADGTHRSQGKGRGLASKAVTSLLPLVLLALVLAPATGHAQGAIAPGQAPPADAIHGGGPAGPGAPMVRLQPSDQAGTAQARIQVVQQTEAVQDAAFAPVGAGLRVILQWRADRGQSLALSYEAVTDAKGFADFGTIEVLRDLRRFELRAIVEDGGVPHVSEPLVPRAGRVEGQLRLLQVTRDSEAVIGGSLVTIMGIPPNMNEHPASYGYVQVQQLVELTMGEWAIFDGSATGVLFEAPIDAQSVQAQVMGGGGKTEVSDNKVRFHGTIYPADERYPPTRMMVSYYLEADGSTLEFEQTMTRSFADVRLTFLRETDLPGRPLIDVTLEAPQFTEFADQAESGTMEGRHVKVARGLSLEKGERLEFEVEGLPYPDDRLPWILSGIALVLLIGGFFLGRQELRRAHARRREVEAGGVAGRAELDAQIEALYAGLTELERDHEAGQLDAIDYERERSRLRTRLALLVKRRSGQGERG